MLQNKFSTHNVLQLQDWLISSWYKLSSLGTHMRRSP